MFISITFCKYQICHHRYANIFVTAPSPENLKTVFEFIIMGLKDLKYAGKYHMDDIRFIYEC